MKKFIFYYLLIVVIFPGLIGCSGKTREQAYRGLSHGYGGGDGGGNGPRPQYQGNPQGMGQNPPYNQGHGPYQNPPYSQGRGPYQNPPYNPPSGQNLRTPGFQGNGGGGVNRPSQPGSGTYTGAKNQTPRVNQPFPPPSSGGGFSNPVKENQTPQQLFDKLGGSDTETEKKNIAQQLNMLMVSGKIDVNKLPIKELNLFFNYSEAIKTIFGKLSNKEQREKWIDENIKNPAQKFMEIVKSDISSIYSDIKELVVDRYIENNKISDLIKDARNYDINLSLPRYSFLKRYAKKLGDFDLSTKEGKSNLKSFEKTMSEIPSLKMEWQKYVFNDLKKGMPGMEASLILGIGFQEDKDAFEAIKKYAFDDEIYKKLENSLTESRENIIEELSGVRDGDDNNILQIVCYGKDSAKVNKVLSLLLNKFERLSQIKGNINNLNKDNKTFLNLALELPDNEDSKVLLYNICTSKWVEFNNLSAEELNKLIEINMELKSIKFKGNIGLANIGRYFTDNDQGIFKDWIGKYGGDNFLVVFKALSDKYKDKAGAFLSRFDPRF